jgi:hypothetical protein
MNSGPLFGEEAAMHRANYLVVVTHKDLTEAAANTDQTIALFGVTANKSGVQLVKMEAPIPFEDIDDAAFNSTAVVVGDGGSTNRFLTSTQLNVNGTEVFLKYGTGTQHVYTADDTVDAVFSAIAAKALVSLDKGEVRFYFQVDDAFKRSAN